MENNEQDYLKISRLIGRAIKNELSPEEKAELDEWILQNKANKTLFDELSNETTRQNELQQFSKYNENKALSQFLKNIKKQNVVDMPSRKKWLFPAAASIILALSFGGYFLLHKPTVQQTAQNQQHDIAPGRNQATLTLANGQKIILTKGLNGKLAQQGNMLVQVNKGNTLTYTGMSTVSTNPVNAVIYNTLSTKKGEQSPYPLILADGTKVWLNAASSITFPTAFNGNERKVTITGEALFEVAHNAAKPFRVVANGQTIEDIGTQFNVNAYDDEPAMKTTLLEGSVKVSNGTASVLLKPGQQAVTPGGSKVIKVENADVSEAIAWHQGMFQFNKASIRDVMRQMSRWYDVEVSYEGNIPNSVYTGEMYRSMTAAKMLEGLTAEKVHYRIEGKKIIITP